MRHRTQLYLDEDQYRWLKQRAGRGGSVAAVVCELIDSARERPDASADPFIRYLLEDVPSEGASPSSVHDLDQDLYA